MAFSDTTWYLNSVGYAAVVVRPQNAAVVVGTLCRQFTTPAVNSERCFVCIVAGTTANVTDATWVLTRGAKTVDGTVTWMECTGQPSVNGDLTNTKSWAEFKASAVGNPSLGVIIKRNNGASYQICTTAGTLGAAEPAFSDTAGVTTTETSATAVWTSLGVVGNFTGGKAPHARMVNVFASGWWVAGSTLYVGANHAESQSASMSVSPSGNVSLMGKILCHNQAGSYPPTSSDLAIGASVSVVTSGNLTVTTNGGFYFYGIAFRAGLGTSAGFMPQITSNSGWAYFDACSFEVLSTSISSFVNILGGSGGTVIFHNTTVKFSHINQCVQVAGRFIWKNTGLILVSGSVVPTVLVSPYVNNFHSIVLEALDLSQIMSSLYTIGGSSQQGTMLVKDCKLHGGVMTAAPAGLGSTLQLVRSSSVP